MTRHSKHFLAAFALLATAASVIPALAQNDGNDTMGRHRMMDDRVMGDGMSGGCTEMMQTMQTDRRGGRPNQQWRHGSASAPNPG